METIASLKPDKHNARKHTPRNLDMIQKSLQEVGAARSIVIDEDNNILAGNGTVEAAGNAGIEKMQIVETDGNEIVAVRRRGLSIEQKKKLAIYDNRTAELADWDVDILKGLETEIDLSAMFSEKELIEIGFDEKEVVEDEIPEVPKVAKTVKGDIYELGRHRLMCGDSTNSDDVAKLIGGGIQNCIADPPYNIGFKYEKIDDKMGGKEYAQFCRDWFNLISAQISGGFIVTPGPKNERLYDEPRDKGIWIRPNATAGASCFHLRLCEPILFYGKFEKKRDTDRFDYSSGFANELTSAQKSVGVENEHAPAKSMKLWLELIGMFLEGGVFDPFGGNGTTLLACEELKKESCSMELSEKYCDVIVTRYCKFIGNDKIKLNGKKIEWENGKQ